MNPTTTQPKLKIEAKPKPKSKSKPQKNPKKSSLPPHPISPNLTLKNMAVRRSPIFYPPENITLSDLFLIMLL